MTNYIIFPIEGGYPHPASPAGLDTSASHFKRVFDDSTQERHRWQFNVPGNFTASPKCYPEFAMASASSGSIFVGVRVISVGSGIDLDATSFDTDNTSTAFGVPASAGYRSRPEIELTSNCSMAACDNALIEFFRDGTSGSDDAAGDLELLSLVFTYE